MDIISDNIVKTRKEYRCETCGRKFPKGTQMKAQVIVDSGIIYTWRQCLTCTELISNYPDEFIDYDDDNAIYPWCVRDRANGISPEELLQELSMCKK
jgi:hypothetical protein